MYNSKKLKVILLLLYISTVTANEPTSPDFSGYTAIGNNQIVNKFTGNLNYSIPIVVVPGPDGSDYQMALTYNSGVQPNQQASWVGYGWSLSPGAITRQKKGFPDDYNNQKIKYWQKFRESLTASKNLMVRGELLSKDQPTNPPLDNPLAPAPSPTIFEEVLNLAESIGISANYSRTTTFNNYNGYSVQTTLGVGAGAFGSLSATWNQKGVPTYFYDLNLVTLLRQLGTESEGNTSESNKKSFAEKSISRLENQALGLASSGFSTSTIYNAITNKGSGKFPSSTSEFTGSQKTFAPTFGLSLAFLKVEAEPGLTLTEITQKPLVDQPIIKKGFGFINSHNAKNNKDVMDYYTEKQSEFTKDDQFLPIPFSNADNFHVSCKDLGGSFRAWSRFVEEYRPNEVKSKSTSKTFGTTLVLGVDSQINFGLGYGEGGSNSVTKGWMSNIYNQSRNNSNTNNTISKYYFKFHNDLGQNNSFYSGGINVGEYHTPEGLDVVALKAGSFGNIFFNSPLPSPTNNGSVKFHKDIIGGHNNLLKQSKNIYYNTNQDLYLDNQNIRKFSKRSKYINGIDDDIITEFKITNENGKNFIFGLPVFSRNERSLSYGINNLVTNPNQFISYTVNNKIVYHFITPKEDRNTSHEPKVILGQELNEPYAESYLVTEILSNNYVDIENDGPTPDDIGGYTIFDYEQIYGSVDKKDGINYDWARNPPPAAPKTSDWYKWRTPVAGYYYDRNSQSDRGDDLISFTSGEKEVYNLKAISTKSHVAIFVNNKSNISLMHKGNLISIEGSGEQRRDSYESKHSEWDAGSSETADITSNKNIRYLERIELWKLDEMQPITPTGEYNVIKKLQTTYFDYDYSAWVGSPDSEVGNGKLTLKKVWTESGDNRSDFQNPYTFEYESDYTSYPTYVNITAPPTRIETPTYNILDIDAWGNYRNNNISGIPYGRHFQEQNWVYQNKDTYTSNNYDPSAWNLKQIKLPSTGKIFIDYEENEYTRVQDENPMTMLSIADEGYDEVNHKIKLNVYEDLGLDATIPAESLIVNDILNLIQNKYVSGDEKIYFNFLYSLVGPKIYNDISNCSSEYIDGFIGVNSVELVDNEIEITLKNTEGVFLPRQICKDFFYSNRYGIYDPDSNGEPPCCKPINAGEKFAYSDGNIENLSDKLGFMMFGSNSHTTFEDEICKNVNLELSYIRIPLPESFPKRGSGVRVKRVLYLDEFDTRTSETGTSARMYGNEYIYENEGGMSSGVAGNEPSSILKENPFYKPIVKRNSSSVYSAGNQVSNLLGPFGASILPSASVGYSRVLSKSIFDNEHHPGFTIDSFLTYKDYPIYGVISNKSDFNTLFGSVGNNKKELKGFSWTNLQDSKKRFIRDPGFTFPSPYVSISSTALASQGFQFITHNFNGKPVSTISYGGRYDDTETWNIGSSTKYEYFDIGEKIPVIDESFRLRKNYIGRDEEIVMEGRFSENITKEWKVEGDLSFLGVFPTEIGGFGNYNTISKELKTHTTNKIISYPAIPKKIITFADGVTTVKENTAFDINTGQPFITRINDKYSNGDKNDSYYQILDIPASYIYEEFKQKSQGQVNTFVEGNYMNESITRKIRGEGSSRHYFINMDSKPYGAYSFEFIKHFNEGDIIEVSPANGESSISITKEYYRVKKVLSDVLALEPMVSGTVQTLPISDMSCNIKIIESGKQNLLNSKAAKIVKDDEAYNEGSRIFDNTSFNTELGTSQTNYYGINIITSSVNAKLNQIFAEIFNELNIDNYKPFYDGTFSENHNYTIDNDYSLPLDILPDTDSDTKSEPITFSSTPVVEYFDQSGEIVNSPPTLTIEELRFKLGDNKKYTENCQENFLNIAFDLCWERVGEETNIDYGNDEEVEHIFTKDLNNIINSSWHLELSDILSEYGLYENVNHKPNTQHIEYLSEKIDIPESIRNQFWDEISEKIGVKNINNGNYSLFSNYKKYLEIQNKSSIYVISHQDSEGSPKKIYFADFYTKYSEENKGNMTNKKSIFGFARNIRKMNTDDTYNERSGSHYEHNDDNEYYIKFVIGEDEVTIENTIIYVGTNNNDLFSKITDDENYPVNSGSIKFIIMGSTNNTNLQISYTNDLSSTSTYYFLDSYILPTTLPADKCCRTYLAVFRRKPYNPNYQEIGSPFTIDPVDEPPYNSVSNYFIYENGQISASGFEDEFICIFENDTKDIDYDGITSLETSEFCIRFAPEDDIVYFMDTNVYAATAVDYKDEWETDKTSTYFDNNDDYSVGKKGRWMSHKSYVYKNPIDHATAFTGSAKNSFVNKGLLKHYNDQNDFVNYEYKDFVLFNWKLPEVNDDFRWLSQSEITSVNDLNQPKEEQSIIGVSSSVFYSESGLKPILYVNNANKDEIFYSSGECVSSVPIPIKPHSGNDMISLPLPSGNFEKEIQMDLEKTYIIKYWLYHPNNIAIGLQPILDIEIYEASNLSSNIATTSFSISDNGTNPIRVGNWDLITYEITPNLYSPPTSNNLILRFATILPTFIDDLLIMPIDATSKSIAYNCENDRVEAEFDSEHFATFFDYDHEGRLIRKRKETYRGIKNIAETFYNTPKVDVSGSSGYGEGLIAPKKKYDQEMYHPNNNFKNEIEIKGGSSQKEQGNKFDIFDLKIDKDGINSKLFNTDTDEIIENLDSLKKNVKNFKIDSLNKDFNIDQLDNKKEIKNKFNAKYNEIDSLKFPELQIDTTGIQDKINGRIESEIIKNGNHNTKIRKGK